MTVGSHCSGMPIFSRSSAASEATRQGARRPGRFPSRRWRRAAHELKQIDSCRRRAADSRISGVSACSGPDTIPRRKASSRRCPGTARKVSGKQVALEILRRAGSSSRIALDVLRRRAHEKLAAAAPQTMARQKSSPSRRSPALPGNGRRAGIDADSAADDLVDHLRFGFIARSKRYRRP